MSAPLSRVRSRLRRIAPGRRLPESRLIDEAQTYWTTNDDATFSTNSHWRGSGPFVDDALWLGIGRRHVELVGQAQRWTGATEPPGSIVEWGCGGGMNAVALAPTTRRYVGVEISAASLAECGRQLDAIGYDGFQPVLIESGAPEAAVGRIGDPVDLFLCTYVFELVPTPEYGLRLLRVARDLLRDGGLALIQIRYSDGSPDQAPRRRRYEKNLAQMTTFQLDEFWTAAEAAGLSPLFVVLVPTQPELRERRYAYFALQKR